MHKQTSSRIALFQEYIQLLQRKTGFRDTLIDSDHKKAFDHLLEEAWNYDIDTTANSELPGILDALNLLASIHIKRSNEQQKKTITQLEREVEELESRVFRLKHR